MTMIIDSSVPSTIEFDGCDTEVSEDSVITFMYDAMIDESDNDNNDREASLSHLSVVSERTETDTTVENDEPIPDNVVNSPKTPRRCNRVKRTNSTAVTDQGSKNNNRGSSSTRRPSNVETSSPRKLKSKLGDKKSEMRCKPTRVRNEDVRKTSPVASGSRRRERKNDQRRSNDESNKSKVITPRRSRSVSCHAPRRSLSVSFQKSTNTGSRSPQPSRSDNQRKLSLHHIAYSSSPSRQQIFLSSTVEMSKNHSSQGDLLNYQSINGTNRRKLMRQSRRNTSRRQLMTTEKHKNISISEGSNLRRSERERRKKMPTTSEHHKLSLSEGSNLRRSTRRLQSSSREEGRCSSRKEKQGGKVSSKRGRRPSERCKELDDSKSSRVSKSTVSSRNTVSSNRRTRSISRDSSRSRSESRSLSRTRSEMRNNDEVPEESYESESSRNSNSNSLKNQQHAFMLQASPRDSPNYRKGGILGQQSNLLDQVHQISLDETEVDEDDSMFFPLDENDSVFFPADHQILLDRQLVGKAKGKEVPWINRRRSSQHLVSASFNNSTTRL